MLWTKLNWRTFANFSSLQNMFLTVFDWHSDANSSIFFTFVHEYVPSFIVPLQTLAYLNIIEVII